MSKSPYIFSSHLSMSHERQSLLTSSPYIFTFSLRHAHLERKGDVYEWITNRIWMSHELSIIWKIHELSMIWISHTLFIIWRSHEPWHDRWDTHLERDPSPSWCEWYVWISHELYLNESQTFHLLNGSRNSSWCEWYVWISHELYLNDSHTLHLRNAWFKYLSSLEWFTKLFYSRWNSRLEHDSSPFLYWWQEWVTNCTSEWRVTDSSLEWVTNSSIAVETHV